MLSNKEKEYLKEVLKLISENDLHLLAQVVTNNMIIPVTTEEALDAIFLHSDTVESVLLRRKVSKKILFKYLHNSNVPVNPSSDKLTMISTIFQMWNYHPCDEPMESTEPDQECNMTSHETTIPKPDIDVREIHEMARHFTHWFYSMLNQVEVQCQKKELGIEHFWQDCNMCLVLNSEKCCSKLEVKGNASQVAQLISYTKTHNKLYFNPNLSNEGVQGKTNVHGLVIVLACGTLHQQDKCVGVFEQLFGLARDPSAGNNWKIKYTELHLNGSVITSLPTVAEDSTVRSISSVPNSIRLAFSSH
ncbi:uncharacterized protein C3orf38 homolog isoform X2 [Zootermopsis nevadensis]|nr:uncharacterized protein C3orf38 homolog isoform X2 [Zootermopsis nevadensis]XP_021933164.1 uncharacterized protein C3orf38 homolog isoform X2 [Zootermopsis nevadensis]XP_021933169.1 uncharacterized protein C3orf38 homolog isoform X2 [Zootermopsis nevadensis]